MDLHGGNIYKLKRGYKVIKQQLVEREGILLENYVMEKR